jgi:hypothetical protein
MRVMFVRQLGRTRAGVVRDVSAGEGVWLVRQGFCVGVDSAAVLPVEVEPPPPPVSPSVVRVRRSKR